MPIRVGLRVGECPRCGRTLAAMHPTRTVVCDCYKYCPEDHGHGRYATAMNPYTPDLTVALGRKPMILIVWSVNTHTNPPKANRAQAGAKPQRGAKKPNNRVTNIQF